MSASFFLICLLTAAPLLGKYTKIAPPIKGLSEKDALTLLKDLRIPYTLKRKETYDPQKIGYVLDQKPEADTVFRYEKMMVFVGIFAPRRMPDLFDQPYEKAVSQVKKLQVPFVINFRKAENLKSLGRVVAQHPQPHGRIEKDTRVRVVFGVRSLLVVVPDIRRMTPDEAVRRLRKRFLKAVIHYSAVADVALAGKIIDTDPGVGEKSPAGSTVSVFVGRVSARYQVALPKWQNLPVKDAESFLVKNGIPFRRVYRIVNAGEDGGRILSSEPSGGTVVEPGDRVVLYVGRHRPVAGGSVRIPSHAQMTILEYMRRTSKLDLNLDLAPIYTKRREQTGRIQRTEPRAGTVVAAGSRVKVYYYDAALYFIMPRVTGLTLKKATARLSVFGITVRAKYLNDLPDFRDKSAALNTVLVQSIFPGTRLDRAPGKVVLYLRAAQK